MPDPIALPTDWEQLMEVIGASIWGDYHSREIGLHGHMDHDQARVLFANEDREIRLVYRAKARAVIDGLVAEFGDGV